MAGSEQSTASTDRTRLGLPHLDVPRADTDGPGATDPSQTRTWAGFALLEPIGRGAFGVVHRAWDGALKREVALKIIKASRPGAAHDDSLLREGQMLARVRHPNVVVVYSAQRIGEEVGLAMEYIRGRTLSDVVAQHGPLSAEEAAVIGLALCDALSAVHRGGLVHRDVKASNVMREAGGRIVLMDFGAGREQVREPGTWSALLGTPAYMSPEVLQGARATPASDIYSVGVLLFHLVTARYPVSGSGFDELLRAHRSGERVSLADWRPDLPATFVAAVERALERDAQRRPQTASALRRELASAVPSAPGSERGRRRVRGALGVAADGARSSSGRTQLRQPSSASIGEQWRVRVWRRALLGVGSALILCVALGLVTTMEFNAVMGRTGAFASESPLAYLIWGLRSLIGPLAHFGIMLLLFNGALLVARIVMALAPSLRGRILAVRAAGRARLAGRQLDDLTTIVRLLSTVGFIWLLVVLWVFRSLAVTFGGPIDSAAVPELAMLQTANLGWLALYRQLLDLDLLLLIAGLVTIVRAGAADRARLSPHALIGLLSVAGLVLLFTAGPWRLMFAASFREARFGDQRCFILGEDARDLLLHCVSTQPPRNRIVGKDHPQLVVTDAFTRLFDAYGSSRP